MSVWKAPLKRGSPFALLMFVAACGGHQPEAQAPMILGANDNGTDQLAEPPIENVQAPLTQLARKDVDATIVAGVPRFLQGFTIVEELDENDRFVGWKVAKVHDRQKFEGLGIGAGDVITSINGLPLERPADAYEVMMGLKEAKSLDVEYLRGGRVMRLSLPIVGESTAPPPAAKQPEKAPEKKAEAGGAAPEKKKPAE